MQAFIFDTFPELVVRLNKMIINEFFATEITKPKVPQPVPLARVFVAVSPRSRPMIAPCCCR